MSAINLTASEIAMVIDARISKKSKQLQAELTARYAPPKCEECNEEMYECDDADGIENWACQSCGWSIEK